MPTAVFIPVERGVIYNGQTVASLFDNFGVPNKKYVDNYGIVEYHYTHQNIVKRGTDNFVYFCDFIAYTDEGIVIDWVYYGNSCSMQDQDGLVMPAGRNGFSTLESTPVFGINRDFYLD